MAKEFTRDQVVVLAQGKLDELYKLGDSGTDAVSLYLFYYYTSNWQHTRRTKATGSYCRKHFHWGKERFFKAKKILAECGLIEEIQNVSKGIFSDVYIKLPYKAKEATTAVLVGGLPTAVLADRPAATEDTNAPSVSSLNTPSVNNLEEEDKNKKKKNSQKGEDEGNQPISPTLTVAVPKRDKARRSLTVPITDIDVKVNEIINFAKNFWANESYTAEGEEEPITPVTRANIIKRLKEGFTVQQFKKAIEDSTFWSAGVPRTLANMTKTKGKFNSYVTWQDRLDQIRESMN